MEPMLSRHLPLITQRIQFRYARASQPPIITPRINFIDNWASAQDSNGESQDNRHGAFASERPSPEVVLSDDGESELSGSDIEEDSEPSTTLHGLITKPPGEPGRPNSGGYNLESKLRGWTPKMFSDISVSRFD